MNNKEQIQEMAKDLEKTILGLGVHLCEKSAEKLYNLGYRKLLDGAVVFSREELNDLENKSYDTGFDNGCEIARKRAVKETAEKFYHKIKIKVLTEDMTGDRPLNLYRFTSFDIMKIAREIVEELGVIFENGYATIQQNIGDEE